MKGLKLGSKIIFMVNAFVALLLLVSYILRYIPPKSFASLSVLCLSVPLLILLNVVFFIYWLIRLKKQLLLSLVVLLLGWNYVTSIYEFSSSKTIENTDTFSIMSYNVRQFNIFYWMPSKTVKEDILEFIDKENPDILCLQEYRRGNPIELDGYYNFNAKFTKIAKGGQTIFSKFPIVNTGSLEFPNTFNNAIFADVLKGKDTIRIYNVHFQSSGIKTDVANLKKEPSSQLFNRVGATFKLQQEQVELFLKHKSKCHYKVIVAGDFNNTAYSYIYKEVKGDDLVDAFEEAGNGLGRTFDFKYFPLRIDFILADKAFVVEDYKSFDVKLSDHFPIKAYLKLH